MSGVSNNPQGIVVPASALQQSNIAMTTVNSQVVSGQCRGLWGHPWEEKGWPEGRPGVGAGHCTNVLGNRREGLPLSFLTQVMASTNTSL